MHTYLHTDIHTYVHTYINTYLHIHTCTYVHEYIQKNIYINTELPETEAHFFAIKEITVSLRFHSDDRDIGTRAALRSEVW